MKRRAYILTMLFILFAACRDQGLEPNVSITPDGKGEFINLFNMKVGQKSMYLRLTGENYSSESWPDYDYTRDTLEVSIRAKENNTFIFTEKITILSESRSDGNQTGIPNLNRTVEYHVTVTEKEVTLQPPKGGGSVISNLFGLIKGKKKIRLSDILTPEMKFYGWKLPKHDITATFMNGISGADTILGYGYDKLFFELNEHPDMSNSPQSIPETIAIHDSMGVIRKTYAYKETDKGYGWDLITTKASTWQKRPFVLHDLRNTEWRLQKYMMKGAVNDIEALSTGSYFFSLYFKNYEFGGLAGCNEYNGEFEHQKPSIFLYTYQYGQNPCAFSSDYAFALKYASRFTASSKHLILHCDTIQAELHFKRAR